MCVERISRGPNTPGLFYRGLSTMRSLVYVLLFTALQAVALLLAIVGVPIVGFLSVFKLWTYSIHTDRYHWRGGKWTWLWDNEEDGILPYYMRDEGRDRRNAFYWSALRNSVNNFRFVPGVSKVGRPLFYRTFTLSAPWRVGGEWMLLTKQFYFKAGWMSDGYPCLSAGAGRGF